MGPKPGCHRNAQEQRPLNAPEHILQATRRTAACDGASLNQFINTASAEELVALGAEELLPRRTADADKPRLLDRPVVPRASAVRVVQQQVA